MMRIDISYHYALFCIWFVIMKYNESDIWMNEWMNIWMISEYNDNLIMNNENDI